MSSMFATQQWLDDWATTPDGVEIAYRDYGGTGPAVVMLPGIGGNLEAIHETALRLAERWRVAAIDPRGIGQSGESRTISTADMVVDVETVAGRLGLTTHAVVGHSLGGIVAGAYGTAHPGVPIVSVDGFAGGVATVGTDADQQSLRRMMDWARISLRSMTAAPEEGDENWKSEQISAINHQLDAMGYRPAHREAMVLRQFVLTPDGRWRRHPSSKIVDAADREAFGVDPPGTITRMFRTCTGPVLILRCTKNEIPSGALDAELDDLVRGHPTITVHDLDLTHTGPVTDGVELTVGEISAFLDVRLPGKNAPGQIVR